MINPTLYSLLRKRFGQRNVKVHKEDQPNRSRYVKNFQTDDGKPKTTLQIDYQGQGEEYSMSCPFCDDTRGRLSVNHMWGVLDEVTGTRNLWLAQCYNEACLNNYETQKALYDQVYAFTSIGRAGLEPAKAVPVASKKKLFSVKPPGAMWRVDDMKRRSPQHPAIDYLESRLFDPAYLGKAFGVAFCPDSSMPLASNRIIAPVYIKNSLVSWQARWIVDPQDKRIPKWWTCPGTAVGHMFYNFDHAIRHKTKVIVEGPPDVWGFGRQAMGVFGKKIGGTQRDLLLSGCDKDDTVVIMLDPTQDAVALRKGEPHHIETAFNVLNETKLRGRIVKVYLPEPFDPGELDREYMRAVIEQAAEEQKVRVSFKSPRRKQKC